MDRRSLLLLLALLVGSCAGLWLLVGRHAATGRPIEAQASVEHSPARATPEAELQAEAGGETRGAPRLGTPRTPVRDGLGPDRGRVAGWLRPHEDQPWRDASVALIVLNEGRPPVVLAQSPCEPDGGFAISEEREGRALFVVLARGYVPRAQQVELVHGRELLLEDFELERGLAIAGSLSSNAQPLARFEVVAVDERDLPVLQLAGGELLWNDPGFDWRFTTAESGADGRYSIGGLHAGDYSVRVSTCRGPMSSLCASDRSPRAVRAPRGDVDFAFESSALTLHFSSAGQPLSGVEVELSSGSWRSGKRSDAQGVASFRLVPRLDCRLTATKAGYEELHLPVSAPPSGASASEEFELHARGPAAEVHFLVSSPSGEAPPQLRVRLFAPAEEPLVPLLDEQLRCTPASANLPIKEFVLADSRPGVYRALLFPGQPWNNEFGMASYIGTHCPSEVVLTIPAEGALRQIVSADRRPALRLEFPDGTGAFTRARCTLRDAAGQELPFVLVDPAQEVALSGHELSSLGPTLLYSTLCVGSASLSVDSDGRTLASGQCAFIPGLVAPSFTQR